MSDQTFTNFDKWNKITGWIVFAIAMTTFALTVEPTVSYWDCGEYIATATKLEIGHPPGAPLFQMLGAFFSIFTTDLTQVAMMVNLMSATASAFTILFLFWSVTGLCKKFINKNVSVHEYSQGRAIATLGSGAVGALAYTFSDSFWFSAVEGEVYAMSSFLMALLLWLGLRWEDEMDKPYGNKWLLVISFVIGLSFGVHILALLIIPSLCFIYFFKKYKTITNKNFIIANILSIVVLYFIYKFMFPLLLTFFSWMELFFVNSIGLPFNTGTIIAGLLIVYAFYFGLQWTRKNHKHTANTVILSFVFILLGLSTWLMLPIRANANTTINENNPASALELLAYYNREQYGDANVFYDKYYSFKYRAKVDAKNPRKDDKPKYEKDEKNGKYVVVNDYEGVLRNYSSDHKGFIPRMVNTDDATIERYKAIAGIPQNSKLRPTFIQNLKFMFQYQFGYMYGRYFMWNFVGRQSDNQGELGLFEGNWISGIPIIDEARLGPQTNLPDDMKNNPGRNTYYFLPLILGLIGLFYQLQKDPKGFYVLLLFFLFTGLAIVFYTNPRPFEPRERDYAVVGSFYIFAMWIGFGVFALYEYLKSYASKRIIAIVVTVVSLLAVPTLMAFQNWDDHDRSGRYSTHMNARSYLDSCKPNAIMYTIGDNDTFPLWYLQEVEGYRTDMKLIVTSYLNTDWYIDQMKRATYESPPIPSQLTHEDYKYGSLDLAYHLPEVYPKKYSDTVMNVKDFVQWMQSDSDITFVDLDEDGVPEKVFPTNKIRIPVDKEAVLRNGIVKPEDADLIVPYIDIEIKDQGVYKNTILMLDVLANNNWERPIYFTGGSNADSEFIWMKDYLQREGLVFQLVPIKTKAGFITDMGRVDTESMYSIIKKYDWKELSKEGIYLDYQTKVNSISYRNILIRLAEEFIKEGNNTKAIEVLDIAVDAMPIDKYEHYGIALGIVEAYYKAKSPQKARAVATNLIDIFQQYLRFYSQFEERDFDYVFDGLERNLMMYQNVMDNVIKYDTKDFGLQTQNGYIEVMSLFDHLIDDQSMEQDRMPPNDMPSDADLLKMMDSLELAE